MVPVKKIKIMFLAWGYSIHAKRRIEIFINDPRFDVAVASTYNYAFEGARNIMLRHAGRRELTWGRKVINKLKQVSRDNILIHLADDIVTGIKDAVILIRAQREFEPEVVFLQTLLYPCYLSFFLPRTTPIIITFWNGDVTWWAKWNGIERLLKKKIVVYGVQRAAAITVNSEAARSACLGYGADPDRVSLIRYPGADLSKFRPSSKVEARNALGISSRRVILCPRGVGGYLNSDIIVEAAAAVAKAYSDVLFLFTGGGTDMLPAHKMRVGELGIGTNFRWDGEVSWDLMPLYYNAADLMVSISSNDSLPNCMLESMACGVPLIMGDIPQIGEWITDGNNGFLVPVRDAGMLSDRILKVLENYGGFTAGFVSENLALVGREMDSRKNTEMIKDVVMQIARTC